MPTVHWAWMVDYCTAQVSPNYQSSLPCLIGALAESISTAAICNQSSAAFAATQVMMTQKSWKATSVLKSLARSEAGHSMTASTFPSVSSSRRKRLLANRIGRNGMRSTSSFFPARSRSPHHVSEKSCAIRSVLTDYLQIMSMMRRGL